MPSPGKLPRSAEPPGTYCMIHTHTVHIRARANHWYNPRARLCGRANSTRARGGGFWVGNFRHMRARVSSLSVDTPIRQATRLRGLRMVRRTLINWSGRTPLPSGLRLNRLLFDLRQAQRQHRARMSLSVSAALKETRTSRRTIRSLNVLHTERLVTVRTITVLNQNRNIYKIETQRGCRFVAIEQV